jgi:hypothetical protein
LFVSLFRARRVPLYLLAALMAACNTSLNPPTATAPPDQWQTLAPGLELRYYQPGGSYALTQFVALRIDPALYTFRAHYSPGAPLRLEAWREQLPDAAAIVNANFFSPQGFAQGLLVVDSVVYSESYRGRGGMVQVQNGVVRVRSNVVEPYLGEPLEQAVQAFPMLVVDGQPAYSTTRGDQIARRTVAGQDASGRIVLLTTTSLIGMRLVDLSQYLTTTDLGLVTAVNLDGGGSSLLAAYPPGGSPAIFPSFDAVPVVLAAYPR